MSNNEEKLIALLEEMTGNNLKPNNYIKVMCDYCAEGLWQNGAISVDALPIREELKKRILGWQIYFEENCNPITGFAKKELEQFSLEGFHIALEIKRQLPNWIVVYFDEQRYRESQKLNSGFSEETYRYEIVSGNLNRPS